MAKILIIIGLVLIALPIMVLQFSIILFIWAIIGMLPPCISALG